jgi:hypothetical protein
MCACVCDRERLRERKKERKKEKDRQTDKQTDRQTDRQRVCQPSKVSVAPKIAVTTDARLVAREPPSETR